MLYGVVCYFCFFVVFVYLIAFVGDFYVPKTLSSKAQGPIVSTTMAILINGSLLLLWGVQHSVMARSAFKNATLKWNPHHTQRSTYVLASSVVLVIMMYYWQPMEEVIWQVEHPLGQQILWGMFVMGWILVLLATFLTDHFDLFGLRHSWLYFRKKSYTSVEFTEQLLYRWIRHPMMLGLLIAFWAIPIMDLSHLVFSLGMSIYLFIGIHFEEKALAKSLGPQYQSYQQRTSRVIPKIY